MNKYLIISLLVIAVLSATGGYFRVFGVDSNPIFCDWLSYSREACVGTQVIYNQTQTLIHLEQQNARIGALAVCQSGDAYGEGDAKYSSYVFYGLDNCVSKVLNDTR